MCLLGFLHLPALLQLLLSGRVLVGLSTSALAEPVREMCIWVSWYTFSSSKISAVWYGLDDHIIFTLGNAIVKSTNLDCRSCCPIADVKSANGYRSAHS